MPHVVVTRCGALAGRKVSSSKAMTTAASLRCGAMDAGTGEASTRLPMSTSSLMIGS